MAFMPRAGFIRKDFCSVFPGPEAGVWGTSVLYVNERAGGPYLKYYILQSGRKMFYGKVS